MSANRFVVRPMALAAVFCSALLSGQGKPAQQTPNFSVVHEFPVTMRQNVTAGKTPAGTKVEAKLTIATFLNGTVIPSGATFSGVVVESAAKSAANPSRLAIRMDSAHWRKGSTPVKIYLTAWYYPIVMPVSDDSSVDLPQRIIINRKRPTGVVSGTGAPPPGAVPDDAPVLATKVSENRVVMKDIESTHGNDGALVLTSSRNIKLDKTTTYVLATGDLSPGK